MQGLVIDTWYKAMMVSSIPVGVLSGILKDRSLVAVALGLLLFGLGQWRNHRKETSFFDTGGNGVVQQTQDVRRITALGLVLEVLGCGLALAGIARLLISLL